MMRFLLRLARLGCSKNKLNQLRFSTILIFIFITIPISVATTQNLTESVGEPPEPPVNIDPLIFENKSEEVLVVAGGANVIYLPLLATPDACSLNAEEQAVANLAMNNVNQGRMNMICDPILSQVARERAMDMAQRSYFGHTNPDGFGPNYLVKQAGYGLPTWYSNADDGNNIESIAAGYGTANSVWAGWLSSSGHRAHVLAESPFWQSQTHYGIGYYYDAASPYRHYWVFLSAPPE